VANADETADREEVLGLYDDQDRELVATIIRSKDRSLNRVEEIIAFAQAAGVARIGVAYCRGLAAEAENLREMLDAHFQVTMVDCKVHGLDNADLVEDASGAACNPVGQAKVLADADTQLNIALGLCLGHDMLFAKHSQAPVTTLGVKDRVLGNDPLAVLRG